MAEPEHVRTTRAAYDATADLYAQRIGTELTAAVEGPLDRALLQAFVEIVSARKPELVGDLGCGTGRVAALLAANGLDVVGIDLSPAMLAIARQAHPRLRFEEGMLSALPLPTGSLSAAVCWYSIIHTPPDGLDDVVRELARVLAIGAPLLVAFQAGDDERVDRSSVLGRPVSLTNHRHSPDEVARRLSAGGLEVTARLVRSAQAAHEATPQAFLLAERVPDPEH